MTRTPKTHCKRGHELAGPNLVIKTRANGEQYRNCRTCNLERARKGKTPVYLKIWRKVEQDGNGCWVYTGRLYASGYGAISVGRRNEPRGTTTHRAMYLAILGPIPDGLHLDHLCRNRACCNPWHLEPVTPRENILRGVGFAAVHAAKTHCVNGHPFDDVNTYRFARPEVGVVSGRSCRTCHRMREAQRRERLAAERSGLGRAS